MVNPADDSTEIDKDQAGELPSDALQRLRIAIPGFRLKRMIKKGGQAIVYKAEETESGKPVAIKLLLHGQFADDAARSRLEREVISLQALKKKTKNIASFIKSGRTGDGHDYLVMEYIEGRELDRLYPDFQKTDCRSFDWSFLLDLFLKICDTMNAAHLAGVTHRDLSPSNILIDAQNEPHIIDFGLARTAFDRFFQTGSHGPSISGAFVGKPAYASPEQADAKSESIGSWTDVYALGIILYQILTGGQFPYDVKGTWRATLDNVVKATPTPPSELMEALEAAKAKERDRIRGTQPPIMSPILEAIVLKALGKNPEDRYQLAGALANDLRNYRAGKPTVADPKAARPQRHPESDQVNEPTGSGTSAETFKTASGEAGASARSASGFSSASSPSRNRELLLQIKLPDNSEQQVFARDGLTIGRSAEANDVWIDHADVERIHARISTTDDGAMVLESQSPSAHLFAEGKSEPLHRLALTPGTRFLIGPATLTCLLSKARRAGSDSASAWRSRCPRCHTSLDDLPQTTPMCPECGLRIFYHVPSPGSAKEGAVNFTGWLPSQVGPYAIRSFVAEGGMGIVLKGLHTREDRLAAVKLLALSDRDDPRAEARFLDEVANARSCVDPNLVRLQDSGNDQNLVWMALDWVDGKSLQEYIADARAADQPIPIDRVGAWMTQVVRGLAYLHRQAIIHRDVKPGNILVAADGLVKVADYGIAKNLASNRTAKTTAGTIAGTQGYMSPEQLAERPVGPQSDTYSLGILWYELLTLRRMAPGTYQPAISIRTDCPAHWDAMIARCLQFDPKQRPGDQELLAALDSHQASSQGETKGKGARRKASVRMTPGGQTSGGKVWGGSSGRNWPDVMGVVSDFAASAADAVNRVIPAARSLGITGLLALILLASVVTRGLTSSQGLSVVAGWCACFSLASLLAMSALRRKNWASVCIAMLVMDGFGVLAGIGYAAGSSEATGPQPVSLRLAMALAVTGIFLPLAAHASAVRVPKASWLPICTATTVALTAPLVSFFVLFNIDPTIVGPTIVILCCASLLGLTTCGATGFLNWANARRRGGTHGKNPHRWF